MWFYVLLAVAIALTLGPFSIWRRIYRTHSQRTKWQIISHPVDVITGETRRSVSSQRDFETAKRESRRGAQESQQLRWRNRGIGVRATGGPQYTSTAIHDRHSTPSSFASSANHPAPVGNISNQSAVKTGVVRARTAPQSQNSATTNYVYIEPLQHTAPQQNNRHDEKLRKRLYIAEIDGDWEDEDSRALSPRSSKSLPSRTKRQRTLPDQEEGTEIHAQPMEIEQSAATTSRKLKREATQTVQPSGSAERSAFSSAGPLATPQSATLLPSKRQVPLYRTVVNFINHKVDDASTSKKLSAQTDHKGKEIDASSSRGEQLSPRKRQRYSRVAYGRQVHEPPVELKRKNGSRTLERELERQTEGDKKVEELLMAASKKIRSSEPQSGTQHPPANIAMQSQTSNAPAKDGNANSFSFGGQTPAIQPQNAAVTTQEPSATPSVGSLSADHQPKIPFSSGASLTSTAGKSPAPGGFTFGGVSSSGSNAQATAAGVPSSVSFGNTVQSNSAASTSATKPSGEPTGFSISSAQSAPQSSAASSAGNKITFGSSTSTQPISAPQTNLNTNFDSTSTASTEKPATAFSFGASSANSSSGPTFTPSTSQTTNVAAKPAAIFGVQGGVSATTAPQVSAQPAFSFGGGTTFGQSVSQTQQNSLEGKVSSDTQNGKASFGGGLSFGQPAGSATSSILSQPPASSSSAMFGSASALSHGSASSALPASTAFTFGGSSGGAAPALNGAPNAFAQATPPTAAPGSTFTFGGSSSSNSPAAPPNPFAPGASGSNNAPSNPFLPGQASAPAMAQTFGGFGAPATTPATGGNTFNAGGQPSGGPANSNISFGAAVPSAGNPSNAQAFTLGQSGARKVVRAARRSRR